MQAMSERSEGRVFITLSLDWDKNPRPPIDIPSSDLLAIIYPFLKTALTSIVGGMRSR